MTNEPKSNTRLNRPADQANTWYNQLQSGQTPLEKEYIPQSQDMWNTYQTGKAQNLQDYGNIMGGYGTFMSDIAKQGPTKFGFERVNAERPAELGESYGYLRETMPGYREFAQTGGYSPTDIQELRARGVAPIRAAYGNTMMELNRARALGGAGGAPNYIAAASKAQREMPGQMADAMTTVNAELANAIRQGRLAGLSGMAGVGSTMGGLSSQEAGRMLQAAMANQNADLQAQQLSEQSLQNMRQNQLAGLHGQTSLYGTTPGLASTFGNQALQAYQNRLQLEQMRNNLGLGLLDTQVRAFGEQKPTDPWWKEALNMAGSVIPYLGNKPTPPSGPSGPSGPSSYGPPSINTPITPQNWYNNAPQMPSQSAPPNPQSSSNWYVNPSDPIFGGQTNFGQQFTGEWAGNQFIPYGNASYWSPNDLFGPASGAQTFTGEWAGNDWIPYGGGGGFSGYDFGPEYYGGAGGFDPWGPGSGGQYYSGEWFGDTWVPYGGNG